GYFAIADDEAVVACVARVHLHRVAELRPGARGASHACPLAGMECRGAERTDGAVGLGDGRLAVLARRGAPVVADPAAGVLHHAAAFAAEDRLAVVEGSVAEGAEALLLDS